jgi:hypothetical protein
MKILYYFCYWNTYLNFFISEMFSVLSIDCKIIEWFLDNKKFFESQAINNLCDFFDTFFHNFIVTTFSSRSFLRDFIFATLFSGIYFRDSFLEFILATFFSWIYFRDSFLEFIFATFFSWIYFRDSFLEFIFATLFGWNLFSRLFFLEELFAIFSNKKLKDIEIDLWKSKSICILNSLGLG